MIQKPRKEELLDQFERLTPELQQRVVDFVRQTALDAPRGVRGSQLLRFANTISVDESRQMRDVIDAACGQVDPHAW